eukprot:jgi/Undpi1/2862/HiC_scaffold_14.g06239.m1
MKTSCCTAAAGLLAAGLANLPGGVQASYSAVTAKVRADFLFEQRIAEFDVEDFAFSLGGPKPDAIVDGRQIRVGNLNQLPSLAGQGISMVLVNLDACAINLPHVHPRGTEMIYTIEGNNLRVAFAKENGGDGAVVNDLAAGDVAFFPQGLIHYEQNLDCEPAAFLSALNSEDPGIVTITTTFFQLPDEAIQASLNIDDPTLKALLEVLPEAPAMARRQCLQRCGLLDDDSLSYGYNSED